MKKSIIFFMVAIIVFLPINTLATKQFLSSGYSAKTNAKKTGGKSSVDKILLGASAISAAVGIGVVVQDAFQKSPKEIQKNKSTENLDVMLDKNKIRTNFNFKGAANSGQTRYYQFKRQGNNIIINIVCGDCTKNSIKCSTYLLGKEVAKLGQGYINYLYEPEVHLTDSDKILKSVHQTSELVQARDKALSIKKKTETEAEAEKKKKKEKADEEARVALGKKLYAKNPNLFKELLAKQSQEELSDEDIYSLICLRSYMKQVLADLDIYFAGSEEGLDDKQNLKNNFDQFLMEEFDKLIVSLNDVSCYEGIGFVDDDQ